MKILAFTDLHSSKKAFKELQKKVKKHKPDLIICAGDHTIFGLKLKEMTKKIASLGPVFLIHGNHEERMATKKACAKYSNIVFLHKKVVEYKGYTFFGFGGGGFSFKYPGFDAFVKKAKDKLKGKLIMITHAPPFGSKLDIVWGDTHVGSKTFMSFVKKNKNLVLYISGHIHECMKQRQKMGKCLMVNPGADGMVFRV